MPPLSSFTRDEIADKWARDCRAYDKKIGELEAEIRRLNAVIDHMDRKQQHGCTDALCNICDKETP